MTRLALFHELLLLQYDRLTYQSRRTALWLAYVITCALVWGVIAGLAVVVTR